MLTIYGDRISGNCLKIAYVADRIGVAYRWVDVDILKGESRTPAFLARNPVGQVPCVELADGRVLAQSNAIMLYLAEGTDLVPQDRYERAKMMEWLFWEQYSHETAIAVRRFQKHYLGKADDEIDPRLMERGKAVLSRMNEHLADRSVFVGSTLTLADIALLAYTRLAPEGGFDLAPYGHVQRWIGEMEAALGI